MTILHVKLQGPSTQINLPAEVTRFNMVLRSYRVLFNRVNHGYYQAMVNCSLLNGGNAMSFAKASDAQSWTYDFPIFLEQVAQSTTRDSVDWDFGTINTSGSTITFNMKLLSCIERKRFDQASFESNDPSIQMLYGKCISGTNGGTVGPNTQQYWGNKIPMYPVPYTNQTGFTANIYSNDNLVVATTNPGGINFSSTTWRDADGNTIATGSNVYPTSAIWVNTGVHLVDPQPGAQDFDMIPISANVQRVVNNSGGAISGSGYRRGAIIYPYSIDLVFEITTI